MAKKKLLKKKAKKKAKAKKKLIKKKKASRRAPEPEVTEDTPVEEPPTEEPEVPEPEETEEEEEGESEEDEPEEEQEEGSAFDLRGSADRGRSRIHELGAEMGSHWGTHTAMPLAMAPVAIIHRMPIGIIEFDYRTGGGIVLGRSNRIKGRKDTLKTTMCLRALRAAQKTCRHCKWRLVTDPDTGNINCRCPSQRWWMQKEEDYCWLSQEAAISLFHGHLPEGAEMVTIKGRGKHMALICEPPPHLKGKRGMKKRPIPFGETFRCEPMRCSYTDTEGTIDRVWAEKNGVDPSLVLLIGGKWAEQSLEASERTMLTREFDFNVIDSTSMLETREMLEDRKVGARGTPAGKQKIMGDFIKRVVAAQAEEGLAGRYRPTLLTTSHLTQKGIGGFGQYAHLGATDGNIYEHGIAMDIHMKADRYIFDKEKQKSIRGEFTFTIAKNHCGGMGSTRTSGQIKFWLIDTPKHPVGDSNDLATVMDYARAFGAAAQRQDDPFIKKRGAGLALHSMVGRKVFKTVTKCREYLKANDTVYDDLRARVLEKLIADRACLNVVESDEPVEVTA